VTAAVVHELPMRWADLDSLNHVNNVVYLDYAAESRAMLVDDGVLADLPVRRIVVEFLRPLLLSRRPVHITSTVEGQELVQEIRPVPDASPFARVLTVVGEAESIPAAPAYADTLPCRVRRSDLGPDCTVTPVKVFELLQEARILFIANQLKAMSAGRFVVGRVEVTYGEGIPWRHEPYEVVSWVSRLGTSSAAIEAEIVGDGTVHARASSVLIGFDLETQRSRPFGDDEREAFVPLSRPD
jgi:acyl-CoA thioester hydrolase